MAWEQHKGIKVWSSGLHPDDPRHGTLTGYRAHRRVKERACLDCTQANTDYYANRRDASKKPCLTCGAMTAGNICQPCSRKWSRKTLDRLATTLRKHETRYGETDLYTDLLRALVSWSK